MTYQEAKQAVIEKVTLQRCWRALNPDLVCEIVEVNGFIRRAKGEFEDVWKSGPKARKSQVIRMILRSEIHQRVSAYNMTLPF